MTLPLSNSAIPIRNSDINFPSAQQYSINLATSTATVGSNSKAIISVGH